MVAPSSCPDRHRLHHSVHATLPRAETQRLPRVNLALLLLAVNGYLIKYAQEVRMYSLLFFLSLCSLWLFFRFFNRGDAVNEAEIKV